MTSVSAVTYHSASMGTTYSCTRVQYWQKGFTFLVNCTVAAGAGQNFVFTVTACVQVQRCLAFPLNPFGC